MSHETINTAIQFYRVHQIQTLLGVSRATIWRWCKTGTFPSPTRLSANTVAWPASAVEAWAQSRIEASR